jgi:hypothetical protein
VIGPPLGSPARRGRRHLARAAVLLGLFAFALVALARTWPQARPALRACRWEAWAWPC